MSELCMYEYDTAWGECCQSDDHIVPHPGVGRSDTYFILGLGHEKPRSEVTKFTSIIRDRSAARNVDQRIEEKEFRIGCKKRSTMLDQDPLSETPTSVYPSSSDCKSIKEASPSSSDNDRSLRHGFKRNNTYSNGSEFCNTIHNVKTSAVDNNSFSYPLGDISHTENDLNFLGNTEEKDSNEFLYYGWPEINFDIVDGMFRSCDSTFGFEASREDDLDWFSSADDTGVTGDVLKSNSRFPSAMSNMAENIAESDKSLKSYLVSDFAMTSGPFKYKDSSPALEKSDPYLSFVNRPAFANDKDEFIPTEQCGGVNGQTQPQIVTNRHTRHITGGIIDVPKKQPNLRNQPVEETEELYFGNGSLDYVGNLSSEVLQESSGATSYQASPSMCMQHEQQASSSDHGYQQNPIPYAQTDNRLLFNLDSGNPVLSAVKPEGNGLPSILQRDSFCGSSQLTALAGSAKMEMEKIQNCRGSRTSKDSCVENTSMMIQPSMCDSFLNFNQSNFFGNKFENHNDIEGVNLIVPADIGSSNVQESSKMSAVLDDILQEAASFRQLQLVTERLDLRTKLCIRDSLYRLARSAEQRHHHANFKGVRMGEGTNTFMDMEMDTNPIDRSIAHLLFHRPSESSALPAQDSSLLNSPAVVHRSATSAPVCEETASKMESR